jgi:hypothetical protein
MVVNVSVSVLFGGKAQYEPTFKSAPLSKSSAITSLAL